MKFRSAYTIPARTGCPTGTRYRRTFSRSFDVDGKALLVEGTPEDVYAAIQVAAHGTQVADLISRANRGDTTAIPDVIANVVDLIGAPKSLLEAHNQLAQARSLYESLPVEFRQRFGSSFSSFMSACENGSFDKDFKLVKKDKPSAERVFTAAELKQIKDIIGGSSNA